MKIYISLPITGHDIGQCKALAKDVARIITNRGHTSGNFDTIPTIFERKSGLKQHKKRLYG